jgi:hypothetical protein
MKSLVIKGELDSPYFPEVNFNADTGICEIFGESYMEEAYKFYLPLINWLKEFVVNEKKPLIMNFKLMYFNTSSSRLILDILDVLKKFQEGGNEIIVNWYYDPEDPDVKEEVEDFEIESGIHIELLEFD